MQVTCVLYDGAMEYSIFLIVRQITIYEERHSPSSSKGVIHLYAVYYFSLSKENKELRIKK